MAVPLRILVTGAAGAGSSTLAQALADALGARWLELDDYYWLPDSPPYQRKRDAAGRLSLLQQSLQTAPRAVLAGSPMGWDAALEDSFDAVIFVYLPTAIRLARLQARERARWGEVRAGFLEWAAAYDTGAAEGRSLARHEAWLAERRCPVLRLACEATVAVHLTTVLKDLRDMACLPD